VIYEYNKQVSMYYSGRVQSLFACTKNSESHLSDLQFVARIIAGNRIRILVPGNGFEAAGLVSLGTIVCQQAREAILDVFKQERQGLIQELVS
jgi:hypothetical protein